MPGINRNIGLSKVRQGSNLNYKTKVPTDIAGGLIWFKSSDAVSDTNKVSQLTEMFSGVNHSIQATADKKPTLAAEALNGYPKIIFDGVKNRLIVDGIVIPQPYTYFVVSKLLNAGNSSIDKAFFGSKTAPTTAALWISGLETKIYAGGFFIAENAKSLALSGFANVVNGANSAYYRNGVESTGDAGTTSLNGICLGAYADIDSPCLNFDFYELIIYAGALSYLDRMLIVDYLQEKYDFSFGLQRQFINAQKQRYNDSNNRNSIINSIQSTYVNRSSFSEYSFNTTDTILRLKGISTILSIAPSFAKIAVYENNVYKGLISFAETESEQTLKLTAGDKTVTLVSGGQSISDQTFENPKGTFITGLKLANYSVSEPVVVDQMVFVGDSITLCGDYATNPAQQAFARLFKVENNISSACLSVGWCRLYHLAHDSEAITTTVNHIQSLFANCTGRKILPILIGTNDFGLSSTPAATFQQWYENLLDAIHIADSEIEVYAISPLIRGNDAQLLDDYRTAISSICTARSGYCTYLNGKTILSLLTDFGVDQLHPTIAGSKKLKDAVYTVIFP